jgi:acetyl-CoA carboxylase biotin carboxylase subunit
VHLGERDCSVQRRNQKIIEECPSPIMTEKLRKKMGDASIALAKAVNYENAGTIEFLVDDEGNFYFMEMNTRIQVEHPITEEVYGVDLVKQQLQIASGQPLSHHVLNAVPRHHSIECRINAEDPANNFTPSPGTIDLYYAPGGRGVRIDSHAYAGYPIPPNYDSMIAKLIVHASTREQAIARMRRALGEYMITGIKTTIPLQLEIMQNKDFLAGKYNTGFLERMLEARVEKKKK